MQVKPSERLNGFMTYAFAEVDKAKEEAKLNGFRVLDFGVGDPTEPLYENAIKGLQSGAERHKSSGYPSYIGMKEFRNAASEWMHRRFNVSPDPNSQITSTAGSKEAVFHLPFTFVNQGDNVLMPSIGYPPYKAGTVFAGGIPRFYQLKEENGFLPDLNEIESILREGRTKLIWINYPNNPTTAIAGDSFFSELISLSEKYDAIIASDEAYTEMYTNKIPRSILEYTDDWNNIIAFQSLSKRSNATGIRVGFVVGGKELINYYRKFRTQIDSGIPNAIQEAAISALNDEEHVRKMRDAYDKKRKLITSALDEVGIKYWADSTFYIWARSPSSSISFAKSMLMLDNSAKIGINITPGGMLALGNAPNADNYFRLALVPSLEDTELASRLIKENLNM